MARVGRALGVPGNLAGFSIFPTGCANCRVSDACRGRDASPRTALIVLAAVSLGSMSFATPSRCSRRCRFDATSCGTARLFRGLNAKRRQQPLDVPASAKGQDGASASPGARAPRTRGGTRGICSRRAAWRDDLYRPAAARPMRIASSALGPCVSNARNPSLTRLPASCALKVSMFASFARFVSASTFCVPASAPALSPPALRELPIPHAGCCSPSDPPLRPPARPRPDLRASASRASPRLDSTATRRPPLRPGRTQSPASLPRRSARAAS